MSVRFIHTADLHLGSLLQTVGATSDRLQTQLQEATYTAFERVIDLALAESVDFLLVAGDLYDQKSRSVRANEFIAEQFRRLEAADIPVYVIYGNHDPVAGSTRYVDLPDNVYEFDHQEADSVAYPDEDAPTARLWGQSYGTERESRPLYESYTPTDGRIPHIGLLHTGLTPDADRYVPCSPAELGARDDISYWALGHLHQTCQYREDPPIVQAGIPQGRHVGEPGVGGCVLVEIEPVGDPELEFVPTSPIVWQTAEISLASTEDGVTTLDDIEALVAKHVGSLTETGPVDAVDHSIPVRDGDWRPDGYVCRWELTGRGPAHEMLAADEEALDRLETRLRESFTDRDPFIWTESVVDVTGPPLPDVDELRGQDIVVDEFFALRDDLETDPEMRATLRDEVGEIWEAVDDPEDTSADTLALTDEKFDELVERAERRVLDELVRRRS